MKVRGRGTGELVGQVMAGNHAMLGLAETRGYRHRPSDGPETVDVALRLAG